MDHARAAQLIHGWLFFRLIFKNSTESQVGGRVGLLPPFGGRNKLESVGVNSRGAPDGADLGESSNY